MFLIFLIKIMLLLFSLKVVVVVSALIGMQTSLAIYGSYTYE